MPFGSMTSHGACPEDGSESGDRDCRVRDGWCVFALIVTPREARFEMPVKALLDKTINSQFLAREEGCRAFDHAPITLSKVDTFSASPPQMNPFQ
jgi:hypothetical protein